MFYSRLHMQTDVLYRQWSYLLTVLAGSGGGVGTKPEAALGLWGKRNPAAAEVLGAGESEMTQ